MSYFEQAVYDCMFDLFSQTRSHVRTQIIAGMLGKNDRVIRMILVRLEKRKIVVRKGERGGWMPAQKRKPINEAMYV